MAQTLRTTRGTPHPSSPTVKELASLALAQLAAGGGRPELPTKGDEAQALCDALFDKPESAYYALIVKMIAEGISSTDLIDRIVPDAVRILGEAWLSDSRSFADVTIGSSRLQQTVRNLGARHEKDGLSAPTGHNALLIVPDPEQHTLGAFIIANQLRRRGVWVQMAFECDGRQLDAVFDEHAFSMIGLSLGTEQSLARAPSLIREIRGLKARAPVILGGSVLTDLTPDDVTAIGADFKADGADEALEYCEISMRDTPQPLLRQCVNA